jgi:hypothetical protein
VLRPRPKHAKGFSATVHSSGREQSPSTTGQRAARTGAADGCEGIVKRDPGRAGGCDRLLKPRDERGPPTERAAEFERSERP